jgi:hypothetical protein
VRKEVWAVAIKRMTQDDHPQSFGAFELVIEDLI